MLRSTGFKAVSMTGNHHRLSARLPTPATSPEGRRQFTRLGAYPPRRWLIPQPNIRTNDAYHAGRQGHHGGATRC